MAHRRRPRLTRCRATPVRLGRCAGSAACSPSSQTLYDAGAPGTRRPASGERSPAARCPPVVCAASATSCGTPDPAVWCSTAARTAAHGPSGVTGRVGPERERHPGGVQGRERVHPAGPVGAEPVDVHPGRPAPPRVEHRLHARDDAQLGQRRHPRPRRPSPGARRGARGPGPRRPRCARPRGAGPRPGCPRRRRRSRGTRPARPPRCTRRRARRPAPRRGRDGRGSRGRRRTGVRRAAVREPSEPSTKRSPARPCAPVAASSSRASAAVATAWPQYGTTRGARGSARARATSAARSSIEEMSGPAHSCTTPIPSAAAARRKASWAAARVPGSTAPSAARRTWWWASAERGPSDQPTAPTAAGARASSAEDTSAEWTSTRLR